MKAKMIHRCIHVLDLDASLAFYERALGLTVQRRMGPEDGSWENVFEMCIRDSSNRRIRATRRA